MNALTHPTATQVARRRLADIQLSPADRDAALRQMRRADAVAGIWVTLATWLSQFRERRG